MSAVLHSPQRQGVAQEQSVAGGSRIGVPTQPQPSALRLTLSLMGLLQQTEPKLQRNFVETSVAGGSRTHNLQSLRLTSLPIGLLRQMEPKLQRDVVEAAGVEPATPGSQNQCATTALRPENLGERACKHSLK